MEILSEMGLIYLSVYPEINEDQLFKELLDQGVSGYKITQEISLRKAKSLVNKYKNDYILGADTLVCIHGKILGKPQNLFEARKYLKLISGDVHQVFTGYSWVHGTKNIFISDYDVTDVYIKHLSDSDIDRYLRLENILDAAGAYKIQSFYPEYVDRIEGSYHNVVGLPVSKVYQSLIDISGF